MTAVVDGTLVLLITAILWLYDLPLAAVATATVPLHVLSVAAHHPPRAGVRTRRWSARLSSRLVEDVSGVETVKAFGARTLPGPRRERSGSSGSSSRYFRSKSWV